MQRNSVLKNHKEEEQEDEGEEGGEEEINSTAPCLHTKGKSVTARLSLSGKKSVAGASTGDYALRRPQVTLTLCTGGRESSSPCECTVLRRVKHWAKGK